MRYFAKIKYLGTFFHGFQYQPDKRTVQGELNAALAKVFGAPCRITGCSRTDAGVHANEFCITVDCDEATVPPEKLPVAVSEYLPCDLSLYFAEECGVDFHPRYDVKSKEYMYIIKNSKIHDPFLHERAWFLPREISDNQLNKMRSATKYFVGTKDFATFMSAGSDVLDTVRTIYYLNINVNGDTINISISADGFLYNMVRIIVGTLVDVAYGRLLPEEIENVILSKRRSSAGMTAPPFGLYLNKVTY